MVAAGFTVSCESNLDIPQKRVIDFATFYENASEENAKELIGGGSFMDNSHGLQHAQAYKLTSSNCDCLDKIYENCYKVIYYSNCIIEKIPSNEGEIARIKAEAKFLANNDSDGSGLKALNEVRRRAQIPELASMTYQDIKDERRAELWGQRERFYDLQRWGDAPTALKDKYMLLPFPYKQVSANPNLKQNPGW